MLRFVLVILALLRLELTASFDTHSRYQFATELCRKVTGSKQHENIVLSPASIQTCLALAYMGAAGKTAEELKKGLFLENFAKQEDVAVDYGEFLQSTTKSPESKLQMANRIYVNHIYELSPTYNELAAKHFQSKAEVVNFAEMQKAASQINDWVQTETHNKIQNLISPATLSTDTSAVLVNAIYFKADWLHKFNPATTTLQEFHLSAKEAKQVPMMYRHDMSIRYGELPALDLVAVELPYKDSDLRMLILLPNKVDGLSQLQQKFDLAALEQVDKQLRNDHVDVSLPKFKIEFDLSLVETLKSMGITTLFSNEADLHAMLKSENPLIVSEVKHKAYIEVDENGSEAAAATYVQAEERSQRLKVIEFRVNRPFLFAIRDSKAIYFFGHVVKL